MILGLLDEATSAGARLAKACEVIGIDVTTARRWKHMGIGEDRRAGPKTVPKNKLTAAERRRVIEVANSPEHRDLSPKQIVPGLASRGEYVASESTFYRILAEENQLTHRQTSRAPRRRARPREFVATGPNQVWSWDIVRHEALSSRVVVKGHLLWSVAAGHRSWGQPDPRDVGKGGKRPRQSRDGPAPSDDLGPASETGRCT